LSQVAGRAAADAAQLVLFRRGRAIGGGCAGLEQHDVIAAAAHVRDREIDAVDSNGGAFGEAANWAPGSGRIASVRSLAISLTSRPPVGEVTEPVVFKIAPLAMVTVPATLTWS